jgi:hypothetical protein
MLQGIAPVVEFVVLSLVPAAAVTVYWILARSSGAADAAEARRARLFGWCLWVGLVLIGALGASVTGRPPGAASSAAASVPPVDGLKLAAAVLPLVGLTIAESVLWLRRGVAYGTRNERRTVPPRID